MQTNLVQKALIPEIPIAIWRYLVECSNLDIFASGLPDSLSCD